MGVKMNRNNLINVHNINFSCIFNGNKIILEEALEKIINLRFGISKIMSLKMTKYAR
jgi:hypothetical protein